MTIYINPRRHPCGVNRSKGIFILNYPRRVCNRNALNKFRRWKHKSCFHHLCQIGLTITLKSSANYKELQSRVKCNAMCYWSWPRSYWVGNASFHYFQTNTIYTLTLRVKIFGVGVRKIHSCTCQMFWLTNTPIIKIC